MVVDTPSTTSDARTPKRKRVWTGLAYFALLAAGLVAAWHGHKFFFGHSSPADSPGELIISTGTMEQTGSGGGQSTSEPFSMAATGGGLLPMDADPAGVIPPPGSTRLSAYRGKEGGMAVEIGRYRAGGNLQSLVAYYSQAMKDRGFGPPAQKKISSQRLILVSIKDAQKLILTLQNDPKVDNIVQVFLSVMSPQAPATGPAGKSPG